MNLIVIGASGFIGNRIYELGKKRGDNMLGTSYSSENKEFIKFDLLTQNIEDILIDNPFNDNEPTYAVICSAISKIDKCFFDIDLSYKFNVTMTIKLINELKSLGIKFIFLSTESVFDGKVGYYDELMEASPINEYGRQKVEVEKYILAFSPDDLIFRMSMVVDDQLSKGHLFYDWYQQLKEKKELMCIKGQVFSPTYINDVVSGVFCALEKKLHGIYHVTNSEYFEREELARQFLKGLGKEANIISKPLEEFNFPQLRSMKTYLDGYKFRTDTGIQFLSMKEVIKNFAKNLKE